MTMTGTPVAVRKGMTRKQRRLTLIALALGVLGIAAGLVLYALSGSSVAACDHWPVRRGDTCGAEPHA